MFIFENNSLPKVYSYKHIWFSITFVMLNAVLQHKIFLSHSFYSKYIFKKRYKKSFLYSWESYGDQHILQKKSQQSILSCIMHISLLQKYCRRKCDCKTILSVKRFKCKFIRSLIASFFYWNLLFTEGISFNFRSH